MFDADRLAAEVAALSEAAWRPHPKGFPGNDALPLITTDGDPASDARCGMMRPTPHLLACPYLMQVLEMLGATWGRARLMRLAGDAEVTPHVDTDYYWRDHMRVHVPIKTQPTVRFHCGGETVNMAAGECWIFDTWSLHSVENDALQPRIHLVADTIGGDAFLSLMEAGRTPGQSRPDWSPARLAYRPGATAAMAYESYNLPTVMTPWELRDHLGFLMIEAGAEPRLAPIGQALNRLRVNWHALWAQAGDQATARPAYAKLLAEAAAKVTALGANEVGLRNSMSLGLCLKALVFDSALAGGEGMDADDRPQPGAAPVVAIVPTSSAVKPRAPAPVHIDRPIFIVSTPRAGSSLLFETLAAATDVFTIGGESHSVIEDIPELTPSHNGWLSNRLADAEATSAISAELRSRFEARLRDRDGRRPTSIARMLEKTPKNALRIPFLRQVFPDACFLYLHRDPRPNIASMIEAWESQQFRTYAQLPGWTGPSWSLLLTPGWRELIGEPLNVVAAAQWASATEVMLDDLEALRTDRWAAVRYETFIANPAGTVADVCTAFQLSLNRPPPQVLPPARNTLTLPMAGKWRTRELEIEAAHGRFAVQAQRSERLTFERNASKHRSKIRHEYLDIA